MARCEIEAKCQDLLQDVLGKDRANSLIGIIWAVDKLQSVRELRPLLSA